MEGFILGFCCAAPFCSICLVPVFLLKLSFGTALLSE